MALVIEDGTGKEDSQSYVDAVEIRAFAAARGVTLPAAPGGTDPDPVEAMAIQAMDYIESLEPQMKGKRTNANAPTYYQALSFPRTGVRIGCEYETFPDDKIPSNLVAAQCQAVIAISKGFDLQPILDPNARLVKRTKVDVIEKEFFSPQEVGAGYGATPTFPALEALLRPLLRAGGATTAPAYRA